jgi:hypothetical protein
VRAVTSPSPHAEADLRGDIPTTETDREEALRLLLRETLPNTASIEAETRRVARRLQDRLSEIDGGDLDHEPQLPIRTNL